MEKFDLGWGCAHRVSARDWPSILTLSLLCLVPRSRKCQSSYSANCTYVDRQLLGKDGSGGWGKSAMTDQGISSRLHRTSVSPRWTTRWIAVKKLACPTVSNDSWILVCSLSSVSKICVAPACKKTDLPISTTPWPQMLSRSLSLYRFT